MAIGSTVSKKISANWPAVCAATSALPTIRRAARSTIPSNTDLFLATSRARSLQCVVLRTIEIARELIARNDNRRWPLQALSRNSPAGPTPKAARRAAEFLDQMPIQRHTFLPELNYCRRGRAWM